MINNIKKVSIPIFISILIGAICGSIVYSIYNNKVERVINSSKIYVLLYGEYNSVNDMNSDINNSDYYYLNDNGIYMKIVGITKDKNNINTIKSLYENNVIVREYYLENGDINNEIIKYDNFLTNTKDKEEIIVLTDNLLKVYKNSDNNKLIKG